MNLAIRPAEPADIPQLLALYKLLDIEPQPEMPIDRARARFFELSSYSGHRIYVAEADHRIVGTFALIFVGGLAHGARSSCVVEDVVVASEMQGAGIGKEMMRFAMQLSTRSDCYKLVLSSHLDRNVAHQFYESLGFRKHGYSFLIKPLGAEVGVA